LRVTTRSQIGLKQPALTVGDADKDDDDVEGDGVDDDDDEFHLAPLYEEKQPATASSLFQFTAEPSAKWKRKKTAATPGFDFNDISAIRGRFLLIFALDKLNVRHISTSALVDLLT